MGYLCHLDLSETSITELPSWIENLSGLWYLNLNGCKNLTHLGSGISKLKNLTRLDVSGCKRLKEIVDLPGSVTDVAAANCESLERFSQLGRPRERGLWELQQSIYSFANDWRMVEYMRNISERVMVPFSSS